MADHAKLSASGSKRWLMCPPSAQLESQFPDSSSAYAEEGTLAHELSEIKIRQGILRLVSVGEVMGSVTAIRNKANQNGWNFDEMSTMTELYKDIVEEKFNAAKATTHDAVLLIEQRLDFSHIVPEGFGTGDAIIIADGKLEVIDFKYGKGVPVSAVDNPQMRLYGLGALNTFGCLFDIHEVSMTIVQPRLDSISTEVLTVEALELWAEEYVKPRALMAWNGEGQFCTGDHCKFCKAKAICRARAEEALSLAKHDFAQPPILTDDEIPEILILLDKAEAWLKDIREYAYNKALSGHEWDGFKLVEGRSNRKYTDESDVVMALLDAGYSEKDIYEPQKLKGITALSGIIGKKKFDELLEGLIIKPEGKPTLVPVGDERPVLKRSAADDFKEE